MLEICVVNGIFHGGEVFRSQGVCCRNKQFITTGVNTGPLIMKICRMYCGITAGGGCGTGAPDVWRERPKESEKAVGGEERGAGTLISCVGGFREAKAAVLAGCGSWFRRG